MKKAFGLGRNWRESFHWDLVSRRVAEVKMQIEDKHASSRKKFRIWQGALKSDIGNIVRAGIGEEMEEWIRWAQREEWEKIIVANLETSRKKDKVYDAKMAFLVYYNGEIDLDEKVRRLNTLMLNVANNVVLVAQVLASIPWPQAWHNGEDIFTHEERGSVANNFPIAKAAIQRVSEIWLNRRRQAFPAFGHSRKKSGDVGSRKSCWVSRRKETSLAVIFATWF
jgi:hypothetical protein